MKELGQVIGSACALAVITSIVYVLVQGLPAVLLGGIGILLLIML